MKFRSTKEALDRLDYMLYRSYRTGSWNELTDDQLIKEEEVIESFRSAWQYLVDNKEYYKMNHTMRQMLRGITMTLVSIDIECQRRGLRVDEYTSDILKLLE